MMEVAFRALDLRTTSVSLPWAAACALTEISLVAASCFPAALVMRDVTSLMSRTALPKMILFTPHHHAP
jgi:hypothetical protein